MNRTLHFYPMVCIISITAALAWPSVPGRLSGGPRAPGGSAGSASLSGAAPQAVALQLVRRELVWEDALERLFSLHFPDPDGNASRVYLREPVRPGSTGEPLPGVVRLAGRSGGRAAATLISGSLDGYLVAVEYPHAIPRNRNTL